MTLWPENPGLDELLADSLVQAAMRADGVEPETLQSLMKTMARKVAARRAGFLLPKPTYLPRAAVAGPVERRTPPFVGAIGALRDPCGAAPCW